MLRCAPPHAHHAPPYARYAKRISHSLTYLAPDRLRPSRRPLRAARRRPARRHRRTQCGERRHAGTGDGARRMAHAALRIWLIVWRARGLALDDLGLRLVARGAYLLDERP